MPAWLAVSVAMLAAGTQAPPERVVDGLMLMTSDPKLPARVERDFRYGMRYADLGKLYSAKRFQLIEWGKRSAVIIDLDTGPAAMMSRKVDMLSSLAKAVKPNGTVRLADLDPSTRQQVLDANPQGGTLRDGFDASTGGVGFVTSYNLTATGPGRSPISLPIQSPDGRKAMQSALNTMPILYQPPKDEGDQHYVQTQAQNEVKLDTNFNCRLFGIAPFYYPEGLKIAAKALDEVYKKLEANQLALGTKLLSMLHPSGSQLPADATRFSDLPAGARNAFSQGFADSYKLAGFDSPEAATAFLNGASVQISTSINLRFCMQPGDPSNGIPSSGIEVQIMQMPGGMSG